MHHDIQRFVNTNNVIRLRPETDVPGLYLAGQDILTTGIS
jgi:hypothetical protein